MALVAYSDSESSESEEAPKPTVKAQPKPAPSLIAGFAVNKSNPRKIQVSLGNSVATPPNRDENGEPAPKRVKVGSGRLGGFNAMLPSPKRATEKKTTSNGPLRKVFSLKTGVEPGFNRDSDAELRQLLAEQTPTTQPNSTSASQDPSVTADPPKMGNPMRFRPLSIARNTKNTTAMAQLKKARIPVERMASQESAFTSTGAAVPATKPPKINLFSAEVNVTSGNTSISNNESADIRDDTGKPPENDEGVLDTSVDNTHGDPFLKATTQAQSLDTIAADLNLSAADRRRLFGREGKGSTSAINIVNFNTDQEYAANEALRASGEQVQHNQVRGIAPGKHSLKQLVNAATTQKDALEESFAAGKSNKREAGSRYGW